MINPYKNFDNQFFAWYITILILSPSIFGWEGIELTIILTFVSLGFLAVNKILIQQQEIKWLEKKINGRGYTE